MGKQELMDRARDELFSHIHRCGVLQASVDDQDSWMTETIEYLAERYPDLTVSELAQLKTVGLRFCQPVISRLKKEEPAEAPEADEASTEGANGEAAVEVTAEAGDEAVSVTEELTEEAPEELTEAAT